MSEKSGFFGNVMTIIVNGEQSSANNSARLEIKRANGVSEMVSVKNLSKIRLEWNDSVTCVFGAVKLFALDTPLDFETILYSIPHFQERKQMVINKASIEEVRREYGILHLQRPAIRASNNVDMSKYAGYTGR